MSENQQLPDTTEAVAAVLKAGGGVYWPTSVAALAIEAERKALADAGAVILMPGEVPPWMEPWGFLKDGGGYVFDGTPGPDGFECRATLAENELRLYRPKDLQQ